ncbi:MAG: haloacid dehalogenase-like hydrolase [Clostridia bacterium]|nr:haloacid dehalogenase-like hydrolase [Clostridia bacterium]
MPEPIVALLYDFDRTLSTEDMQNYSFIPSLDLSPQDFWDSANSFAQDNKMDGILAYMYTMIRKAKEKGARFNRDTLVEMGKNIEFFKGVDTWFKRINDYGKTKGVLVEHYVISSGLREIIEGCAIKDCFKEIFACEFLYDGGEPVWPKVSVNYTNKTQFIYRINKGVLDISDDKTLNASMPDNDKRVRFSNMIYLGDGLSDVPCMKMVKAYGGKSIAVYAPEIKENREKFRKFADLLLKDRVDFLLPADYRENTPLEDTVKNIISSMAAEDLLDTGSTRQRDEISKVYG